jgi:adenylate cyclase
MIKLLKRPDLWFTLIIFSLMIPAEHYEIFPGIENQLQGYRHLLRWSDDPEKHAFPDQEIVIVDTDEQFFSEYGSWPLQRRHIADIVTNLQQLGAKVVALDMLMDFPNGYGEDPILADALREKPNTMVVAQLQMQEGQINGVNGATPVLQEATVGGYTNHTLIGSMLSRVRIYPEAVAEHNIWPWAVQALAMYWGVEPKLEGNTLVMGDRRIPLDHNGDLWIDYPAMPAGAAFLHDYAGITAAEILNLYEGEIYGIEDYDEDEIYELEYWIKDKLVLVGDTTEVSHDIFTTPVGEIYGVELLAYTIWSMMNGGPIKPLSSESEAMILIGMMVLFILISQSSKFHNLLFLLAIAAYIGVAFYAYIEFGIAMSMTYVLLASLLSFITINLYLFMSERQEKAFIKSAFSQYLSPDVIDVIVEDPSKLSLGGERREMTAYFSDVQGFSTISEALTPDELVALLNEYLTEMCNIIAHRTGTIDKFEGDAIIAFWGAPLDQPDHTRLCCYAMIDMQKRLEELRVQWKEQQKPQLFARQGVNSGPIVVGNMGSQQRMDYTIMGDTVNLAARLEGANKFYKTFSMISGTTYHGTEKIEGAKDYIDARELDIVRVVGKKEPVPIFEVLDFKNQTSGPITSVLEHYTKGLECYKERDYVTAIEHFQKGLQYIDNDGPCLTYIKRCQTFLETPPPSDWDGVYTHTEKG